MKLLMTVSLFLTVFATGHAENKTTEKKLNLSLSLIERSKDKLTVLIHLENLSKKPIRVLKPSFSSYYGNNFGCGGYSLYLTGPNGKPTDISFLCTPGAVPGFPKEKDTVILKPKIGISMRITLTGVLADPAKVSNIKAYYRTYGNTADSVKKYGGSCILMDFKNPPLLQGFITETSVLDVTGKKK